MIDKTVTSHLIRTANHLDAVASRYKAAKYWLLGQYTTGFSCFVKYEAMERWKYAGEIRKYVIKHEGIIESIGMVPEIPLNVEGISINSCMNELLKHDKAVIKSLKDTMKTLFTTDNQAEGIFLSAILEKMQKDLMEVIEVEDFTRSGTPVHLLEINDMLYKRYGTNPCGK